MELENVMTAGSQVGLKDAEIGEFLRAEEHPLTEGMLAESEVAKAAAEREHENLLLKVRFQEGPRNHPEGEPCHHHKPLLYPKRQ